MSDQKGASKKPVICAPCFEGRHSSKGPPEYGDSDVCPDVRCQCSCRTKPETGDSYLEIARSHLEKLKTSDPGLLSQIHEIPLGPPEFCILGVHAWVDFWEELPAIQRAWHEVYSK